MSSQRPCLSRFIATVILASIAAGPLDASDPVGDSVFPVESNLLARRMHPEAVDSQQLRNGIEAALRIPEWRALEDTKSATQWTRVSGTIVDPTPGVEHDKIGRIRCAAWAWHNGLGETTLWAGASSGGLWYLSRNVLFPWWRMWMPASKNLPGSPSVGAFLVRPADSNQILVGTGDWGRSADSGTGLYRTTDGGASWTRIPMSPEPSHFFKLMIDPASSNDSLVYAATSTGVFISSNFGLTWGRAYSGSVTVGVTDIARATSSSDWILGVPGIGVVRCSALTTHGSLCTNDTGIWGDITRVSVGVTPANTNWVYALVSGPTTTLNGIYRSSDGGSTFVDMDPRYTGDPLAWGQAKHTHAIAVDPASANRVIVGMAAAQMTLNATASNPTDVCWHRNVGVTGSGCDTTGLDAGHVDQTWMAFVPQSVDPGNTDVLITNDGGITTYDWFNDSHDDFFNEVGLNVSQTYNPQTFDLSRTDPTRLLAGTQDNGMVRIGRGSAGEGYRFLFGGDGGTASIHPTNENQLAVTAGMAYNRYFWQDEGPQVPMNSNLPGGGSPSMVYNHYPNLPIVLTHSDRYLYWRWSWEGPDVTWRYVNPSHPLPSGINIQGVETGRLDPLVIYITDWNSATNGAALYAMEEGVTGTLGDMSWEDRTPDGPFVADVPTGGWAFADRSSAHGNFVTFATGGHRPSRIYLSPDKGDHWWDVTGDLKQALPNVNYWQLVIHPMDQHQQFLATEVGVFRSDDAGVHWYRYMDGLPAVVKVRAMQIRSSGPDDTELVIATWGHGIWERSVEYQEGALFGDGFETGTTGRWDGAVGELP